MAWDRYAYVLNNPLSYTDPTGHCADGEGFGGCDTFEEGLPPGITDPENRDDPTKDYPDGFIEPSWEYYKKIRDWLGSQEDWRWAVDINGKIDDEVLMALIILGEFSSLRTNDPDELKFYYESLEALSNQYDAVFDGKNNASNIQCGGDCTIQEQLMWLSDNEGWYSGDAFNNATTGNNLESFIGDAHLAANNFVYGDDDDMWGWGNVSEADLNNYRDYIKRWDEQDNTYYIVYGGHNRQK